MMKIPPHNTPRWSSHTSWQSDRVISSVCRLPNRRAIANDTCQYSIKLWWGQTMEFREGKPSSQSVRLRNDNGMGGTWRVLACPLFEELYTRKKIANSYLRLSIGERNENSLDHGTSGIT
jgi:hypothetical protein